LSSPFSGLAPLYRKFRPSFPAEAAQYLCEIAARHTKANHLLDVGTGTGQVMLAMAPHFEQIIGIDPDMEMLEAASDELRAVLAERRFIRLFCSRIEDFTPPEGWQASLVTFSRSFHWVEQDATLTRLAGMTEPNGLVALTSDRSLERGQQEWHEAVRDVVNRFLGQLDRPWLTTNGGFRRDWGDVLRASPFSEVSRASFPVHRIWTSGSIIGYLYSTSTVARHRFGERAEEFEETLRKRLRSLSSEDRFEEEDEWEVIVGRK
jgi:SAM-dependent methyltransferase